MQSIAIIPCNLCGSQPNLQRQVIADMLRDWDKRYPGRIETMFSAMQNVVPSHLCDTNLFDFKGITHGSEVVNGGDLAFDREEIHYNRRAGSQKKMKISWMSYG